MSVYLVISLGSVFIYLPKNPCFYVKCFVFLSLDPFRIFACLIWDLTFHGARELHTPWTADHRGKSKLDLTLYKYSINCVMLPPLIFTCERYPYVEP